MICKNNKNTNLSEKELKACSIATVIVAVIIGFIFYCVIHGICISAGLL